ncbi:MAG: hypothetical protein EBX09_04240 [Actinobacteria bacterium]|nr:hypothetical protein [Actinomycetota bacterium]
MESISKLQAGKSTIRFEVGDGVGVGDGEACGVGMDEDDVFFISTPLSQTNFLPLLMHVNFFPL